MLDTTCRYVFMTVVLNSFLYCLNGLLIANTSLGGLRIRALGGNEGCNEPHANDCATWSPPRLGRCVPASSPAYRHFFTFDSRTFGLLSDNHLFLSDNHPFLSDNPLFLSLSPQNCLRIDHCLYNSQSLPRFTISGCSWETPHAFKVQMALGPLNLHQAFLQAGKSNSRVIDTESYG